MDNIQFWIYVIFAIIYFVARNFKKDNKKSPPGQPQDPASDTTTSRPQPQSFEDLLEEITGRRTVATPTQEQAFDRPVEEEDERYMQPKPWEEKERKIERANEFEKEGRNRQFADEESRRVYEESIKRAEGADLRYEVDEKFASKKVLRETAEEKETNEFAAEINAMLRDSNEARKAVILGEILNRKY